MPDLRPPNRVLASAAAAAIKASLGISDYAMKNDMTLSPSLMHFHGGLGAPIAWNDVQEIEYINRYSNQKKITVPEYPTAGYNQHGHTSEFDGGLIAGLGAHTHNGTDSNFAFAIFYPATGVPQADWTA